MNPRFLPFFLLATLIPTAVAHAANGDDDNHVIRFHRVFAPETRIREWPTSDGKYLPMETEKFDRLVESLPSQNTGNPARPNASIASAHYEAKLDGDSLVGRGSIQVFRSENGPKNALFEPCNLAIGDVRQDQSESEVAENAVLGLGNDGKLILRADRTGPIRFDWSLAGHRDSAGILNVILELPPAASNELTLDLPKNDTAALDHGLILETSSNDDDSPTRRWRMLLDGSPRVNLRIFPAGVPTRRPQLALLRESRTYDLSLRGVEVSAQWRIQVYNEPLQQIEVLLDPGLKLISALDGDLSIPWSVAAETEGAGTRAVLTLPEPIRDAERVVRVNAIGPPQADQLWRLPRIRVDGLFWQEGAITLLSPDTLLLNHIDPIGCRQTGVGRLPAPREGETFEFQAFDSNATVEVLLTQRPARIHAVSATEIELAGEDAFARSTANVWMNESGYFTLTADVPPDWTIDAVESSPADGISDWKIEPHENRGRLLTIRPAGSFSAERPLRLTVNARRSLSGIAGKLPISDLMPLLFRDVVEKRHLCTLAASGSLAIDLFNDAYLERLPVESLSADEMRLFTDAPRGLLFAYDSRAKNVEVRWSPGEPKYTAAVEIDAAVGREFLRETCTIQCTPESGRLDRVIVQLYPRRDDAPPRWSLGAEKNQPLSARKWSKEEQAAAGANAMCETWELTLRPPRSAPFEITALREFPTTGDSAKRMPLMLAGLPKADSQRGMITIRSLQGTALNIENRRLKSMLPASLQPNRSQSARGVFRFDPVSDVANGEAAAIRVGIAPPPGLAPLWVRNCRLESWTESDGATRYQAVYELQNTGQSNIQFRLPPGLTREDLRQVWIDGDAVAWQITDSEKEKVLTVELPRRRKYPSMTIQWTGVCNRLGIAGSLRAEWPEPQSPVMARQRIAWLPPGYECYGDGVFPLLHANKETWSQRLFGPFGRAEGVGRFDPLSTDHWLDPLSDLFAWEDEPSSPPRQLDDAANVVGWGAWQQLEWSAKNPPSLRYVHSDSIRLFGWVVFLACASLGCWKAADYRILLVALLGIFASAAMLVPAVYSPIASGSVLGMGGCLLWIWVRSKSNGVESSEVNSRVYKTTGQTPPGSTVSMAGRAGLLILALGLTCGDAAWAQNPQTDEAGASNQPIYRVFVPIDAQKRPVGGKVYVPEAFYKKLYAGATARHENSQSWMILKAIYRGVLAPASGSEALALDAIHAQYDLKTFSRDVSVCVPFQSGDAIPTTGGVLLDGKAVEARWDPDAAALVVEVAEPGEYRLQVSLRPTAQTTEGWSRFDIGIPRVARSRLELTLPDNAPAVEVSSSKGPVRIEHDPRRLIAEIGPADRLSIRWPNDATSRGETPAVEADQLVWLKVQPGSVVLDAQFHLRISSGQLQELRLVADSRLRLLPLSGENAPKVQIGAESGQSRWITFRWERPCSDQLALNAKFLLSGATGVGNFRLPQIRLVGIRPGKQWMAFSVDPSLDFEEQQKQSLQPVAIADFLKAWNGAGDSPSASYALPADLSDWTLSTRPLKPRTIADQTLSLAFDEDRVDVAFDALLSPASGYSFQHRIVAPRELEIENISLIENDVERVGRWSHDGEGAITVFLNGTVSGLQRLALRGRLPIAPDKVWPLPLFLMKECDIQSAAVCLYRRPNVTIKLDGPGQKLPSTRYVEPILPASPGGAFGRLVESFAFDPSSPPSLHIAMQLNRPEIRGYAVVRPEWKDKIWLATLEGRLSVRDGAADEIEIQAPAAWSGPYRVDPPGEIKIRKHGAETRRIVYRPHKAIAGNFAFSLSSPIRIERGERLSAPNILPLGIAGLQRWFLLPTQAGGGPIRWQTRGLRPIPWPDALPAAPANLKAAAYEALSETIEAFADPTSAAKPRGSVRLADFVVRANSAHEWFGTAAFDLEPSGLQDCPLEIPKGCELIHLSIEGMPVEINKTSDTVERFPLASSNLPQRVEAVFRFQSPRAWSTRRWNCEVPMLGDLRVDQSQWTIFAPIADPTLETAGAAHVADWQQQLNRLRSEAAALDSVASAATGDAEETMRCFQSWAMRAMQTTVVLKQRLGSIQTGKEIAAAQREVAAVEKTISKLSAQLKVGEPTTTVLAPLPAESSSNAVRLAFNGRTDAVAFSASKIDDSGLAVRWFWAALLALLTAIVCFGLKQAGPMQLSKPWTHAIGAAGGLAWWLWLTPSVLGLGVALTSALLAAREKITMQR